jgi:hypothetical protein
MYANSAALPSKRGKGRALDLVPRMARILADGQVDCETMEELGRASGETLWTLRYHFGRPEGVLRAVSMFLTAEVEQRLRYEDGDSATVLQALEGFSLFLGDLMMGRSYRDLAALVSMRHRQHPWLAKLYLDRIVSRGCDLAQQVVSDSGRRHGTLVILPEEAAIRLFKEIECKRASPLLLPRPSTELHEDADNFERQLARQIFGASYALA